MAQPLQTFEEIGTKRSGSHRGGKRQKYVLDEPGRRLLLAKYDGKPQTITELANSFRVPRHVVDGHRILAWPDRRNPPGRRRK